MQHEMESSGRTNKPRQSSFNTCEPFVIDDNAVKSVIKTYSNYYSPGQLLWWSRISFWVIVQIVWTLNIKDSSYDLHIFM